jgi:outer membrane protein assembly factor BamB
MSNAKPIAAMVQISQAVRFMPVPPAAAGGVGTMEAIVPGNDARTQVTFCGPRGIARRLSAFGGDFRQSPSVGCLLWRCWAESGGGAPQPTVVFFDARKQTAESRSTPQLPLTVARRIRNLRAVYRVLPRTPPASMQRPRFAQKLTRLARLLALALPLTTTLAAAPAATNWPTWRGPSNAGTAPGAQPPLTWSDTENIKWKAKIPGLGFSTPIVWGDRIYLLTAIETNEEPGAPKAQPAEETPAADKKGRRKGPGGFGGGPKPTKVYEFVVLALDRANGNIVWQKTARREVPHEGRHATNSYASASPVTDGEHLYVPFGSRGFYCYDLQGNLKWEKDLGDMTTRGSFGEGASPALAGDHLIIHWDHEAGSFIVALDKKTGREVWRKDRSGERSSWSTPVIVEVGGKLQAIVAATQRTRAYDVKTGDVIWEAGGLTDNVIPTPVIGHGLAYLTSGFRGNSVQAVKLTSRGDVTETDNIVWSLRKSTPYVPSPALSEDRLYFTKSNDAYLTCVNALTGEIHYQDQPLPGVRGLYASPLVANGHVYIIGREGTSLVLKDTTKFEVVATNKLDDRIDASPVALGKELFLRGHEYLYCIAQK